MDNHKKILFLICCFCFLSLQIPFGKIWSAEINGNSLKAQLSALTPAYSPTRVMGISISSENPFEFDFIIDTGDSGLEGEAFSTEATKLIKYFLASLTIPEKQMWVNLSPYEKDRIIPEAFGKTIMGCDLLEQDYRLKQLTSQLMNPEDSVGQMFWDKVNTKARERFGAIDIPVSTFNKIWIVPETASIFEHKNGAIIVDTHLKVLMEEDYLALAANQDSTEHGIGDISEDQRHQLSRMTERIYREILIPEIEREVNEGKTFANLRQIYHSMLLASWYKQALKDSLLTRVYVDQEKIPGVEVDDSEAIAGIYNRYVDVFVKGAAQLVREEYDPFNERIVVKKYFSGGVILSDAGMNSITSLERVAQILDKSQLVRWRGQLLQDQAMLSELIEDIRHLSNPLSTIEDMRLVTDRLASIQNENALNAVIGEVVKIRYKEGFLSSMEDSIIKSASQFSWSDDFLRQRKILSRLVELLWAPDSDISVQSWQDVWDHYIQDDNTLKKLIKLVSLSRKIYPYQLFEDVPPLQVALENSIFHKIGRNVYVTPMSHSFRKHLIFATNENGKLIFVVEFMVPGERTDKLFLGADNRVEIASGIDRVWGDQKIQSMPLRFKEFDVKELDMYAKSVVVDSDVKMQVLFLEYPFDGIRMNNFSRAPGMLNRYANELGVSSQELAQEIVRKTAEVVGRYEALGYVGFINRGYDAHTGNLRVSFYEEDIGRSWKDRVKITTVSDYYGFRKIPSSETNINQLFRLERDLYIRGVSDAPGLSEIFYASGFSTADYYSIFEGAYQSAEVDLRKAGQMGSTRETITALPLNIKSLQVVVDQKSAVGGIDLNPMLINSDVQKIGSGFIAPNLFIDGNVDPVMLNINGLRPVIIHVTPSVNLQDLLG